MRQSCGPRVLAVLFIAAVLLAPAAGQDRRRALRTPGLVIETGRPIATTYELAFTRDGQRLLSAGAGKVVRDWPFEDGRLDVERAKVLRWASWREQRGTIYAMALSPDADQRYVAIGGFGLITGTIAVLDRRTGDVTRALTVPDSSDVVTTLAYSPSGNRLAYGTSGGAVWVWNVKSEKENDTLRLGRHERTEQNKVRMVTFLDEGSLVSVAKDGSVHRWTTDGERAAGGERFRLGINNVRHALLSNDRSWLAAAGHSTGAESGRVALYRLDGERLKTIAFRAGYFPKAVALGRADKQIAIAVDRTSTKPHHPVRGLIALYDKATNSTRWSGFRSTYGVDAIAFHPNNKYLVVAGGNDFELSTWDFEKKRLVHWVRGPGRSLWQVSLSADKRLLGFREQRNLKPDGFNDWGAGPWRAFNLEHRGWHHDPGEFKPLSPLETSGGWRVVPDERDVHVWRVVDPRGRSHVLPLDRYRDLQPRCFTFIPPVNDKPLRLAVGHRWGVSIFELTGDGVRRSRLCVGHSDDVTSVVLSSDRKILVSASRDQTVAAWSLADWEHQDELGAAFAVRDGRLRVTAVAAGSPAWEAGLSAGDEITLLAYHGRRVEGGPERWLRRLRNPVPGHELFFRVRRRGEVKPLNILTTVRQRPVWRFYPTQEGEWVMWRWRDYYYDTSTKGDSYIGWQIIGGVGDTPEFHEAEKFREMFHKPAKVADVIALTRFDPEKVAIPDLLPPKVDLDVKLAEGGRELEVKISALPRGAGFALVPREVSLWINDFKFRRWTELAERFEATVMVPRDLLRSGTNSLIAQAYNQAARVATRPGSASS